MQERNSQQKLALFLLDIWAFFIALNAAIYLRYGAGGMWGFERSDPPWREIFIAFPFVAVVWLVINAMSGSYRLQQSSLEEIGSIVRATLLTFLAVLSATFFYRGFSYSRGMIGFFIPLVLVAVVVERLGFRALRRRALVRFAGRSRVAVLGRSTVGEALVTAMREQRDDYEVVGRVDTEPGHEAGELPLLGTMDDLLRLCAERRFDSLVLVDRQLAEARVLESIEACLKHQIGWSMIPSVHDLLLDRAKVDLIDGIPLVGMRGTNIVGFNWMLKRAFDIVASSLLLLLVSPLMLGVALAIKLSSKGPVFYVQERVGYRGQVFPFFKFRSMHVGNNDAIHREYTKKWITENAAHTEGEGDKVHKIVNDPRVFSVGRFIRKYSVDELPQFLNVLRGEMSLIGPRPALPYEVDVYREWHRRRFEAPPGITGLWQVSGRNRLSFEEMIKLDIDYLENWSLLLDVQILWRTVRVVLFEHAY